LTQVTTRGWFTRGGVLQQVRGAGTYFQLKRSLGEKESMC